MHQRWWSPPINLLSQFGEKSPPVHLQPLLLPCLASTLISRQHLPLILLPAHGHRQWCQLSFSHQPVAPSPSQSQLQPHEQGSSSQMSPPRTQMWLQYLPPSSPAPSPSPQCRPRGIEAVCDIPPPRQRPQECRRRCRRL